MSAQGPAAPLRPTPPRPAPPYRPQGSCGYGLIPKDKWPYFSVAALSNNNSYFQEVPGHACGACFQIQCASGGPPPAQGGAHLGIQHVCVCMRSACVPACLAAGAWEGRRAKQGSKFMALVMRQGRAAVEPAGCPSNAQPPHDLPSADRCYKDRYGVPKSLLVKITDNCPGEHAAV